MKSTKNMLTYYKIKSNFNKKFDELEAEMLKGVQGSKEKYDKLLSEYKKFTQNRSSNQIITNNRTK